MGRGPWILVCMSHGHLGSRGSCPSPAAGNGALTSPHKSQTHRVSPEPQTEGLAHRAPGASWPQTQWGLCSVFCWSPKPRSAADTQEALKSTGEKGRERAERWRQEGERKRERERKRDPVSLRTRMGSLAKSWNPGKLRVEKVPPAAH